MHAGTSQMAHQGQQQQYGQSHPGQPPAQQYPTAQQQQQYNQQQQQQQQQQQGFSQQSGMLGAGGLPWPALYLYPLNDSFVPKHIMLSHNTRVKIGRQTNAKTAPGEKNGYFDSKVLSRQHAEVWEEGGKIFIKDVKSSNGTFINGERLSSEAVESEPYEVKSDDIVEFGIDIVGEDNKTIIHHKVAARVLCIFSEADANVAARAEAHQASLHQQSMHQQGGIHGGHNNSPYGQQQQQQGGASAGFNFAGVGGIAGQQQAGQQGQRRIVGPGAGLGGMGGGMGVGGMGGLSAHRVPGKSGLTFDVILNRLQGELQKSRETGAELSTLTGAMGEVHEALSSGLPKELPHFPAVLPPVRVPEAVPVPAPAPPVEEQPQQEQQEKGEQPPSSAAIIEELQAQLRSTQETLGKQLEKMMALERVLGEAEEMRGEVRGLRAAVDAVTAKVAAAPGKPASEGEPSSGFELEGEEEEEDYAHDDDDDARSVATVMPGDEDEQDLPESKSTADQQQVERPGTPEPSAQEQEQAGRARAGAGSPLAQHVSDPEENETAAVESSTPSSPPSSSTTSQPTPTPTVDAQAIQAQIAALTKQVDAVVALTARITSGLDATAVVGGQVDAQSARLGRLEERAGKWDAVDARTRVLEERASRSEEQQQQRTDRWEERSRDWEERRRLDVERMEERVRVWEERARGVEVQQETIRALESKVEALEKMLQQQATAAVRAPPASDDDDEQPESTSLAGKITAWMKSVDLKWGAVQEEWRDERVRLGQAREEWEALGQSRAALEAAQAATTTPKQGDDGDGAAAERERERESVLEKKMERLDAGLERLDGGLERLAALQHAVSAAASLPSGAAAAAAAASSTSPLAYAGLNGDAVKYMANGLVTPPSPRSESSDSARYSGRRKRRAANTRSRSRSPDSRARDVAALRAEDGETDTDGDVETELDHSEASASVSGSIGKSSGLDAASVSKARRALVTPEPSLKPGVSSPTSPTGEDQEEEEEEDHSLASSEVRSDEPAASTQERKGQDKNAHRNAVDVRTAVGILVLSVAAAAVIWRVKPE